jgi:heme exporter protein B
MENRETLAVLVVFSLAIAFVFAFAFDLSGAEARRFLPGLLWMTFLFASVLGTSKSVALERRGTGYIGLLLAPIPKEAIFLGKAASSLVFLLAAQLLVTPLFFVFFGVKLGPQTFGFLTLIFLLGSLGLTAIGTFLAQICQVARSGDVLFSLGYFPLVVPVLIAATQLSRAVLSAEPLGEGPWLQLLAVFDVIYSTTGWLLFRYLVEE